MRIYQPVATINAVFGPWQFRADFAAEADEILPPVSAAQGHDAAGEQFLGRIWGLSTEGEARVYQLLNIISLATSFCDVIYTFGRYYLNKFGWEIDFNIVLGADLNGLYEEMVRCVKRPANRAILDEIESIHERM